MHVLGPHCIFHVSSNAIVKVNEGSGNRAIDVSSLLCSYRAVAISSLTDCASFDDLRFFIGLFVSFAVNVDDGNSGWIGLISLHPVGALSYGLQVIGTLEDQKIGLQSNTVGSSDTSSGWTVENAVQYLLMDCLIYGFLVSFFYLHPCKNEWKLIWYLFDRLGISIAQSKRIMVSLCRFGSHLRELTGFRSLCTIILVIPACSTKKMTLPSHLKLSTEEVGKATIS